MSLQMYKEMYMEEWQRRDQLQASAGTPISIVTILGGGLLLMGKGFDGRQPWLYLPFWAACAVAVVCVAVAVYCIVRSVHGHGYERIPHASQLAIHHTNLKEFYASAAEPDAAQAAFDAYLARKYIAAADSNAVKNINRGEWLNLANRWLVYALCSAAVAGIPAALHIKMAPEKPQKIEITNLRSTFDVEARSLFGPPCPRWAGCAAAGPVGVRTDAEPAGRSREHQAADRIEGPADPRRDPGRE